MAAGQPAHTVLLTVTPIPAPTSTATSDLKTSSAGAPNGLARKLGVTHQTHPSIRNTGMPFPIAGLTSTKSPRRPFSLPKSSSLFSPLGELPWVTVAPRRAPRALVKSPT
jgi:hypothetical protein